MASAALSADVLGQLAQAAATRKPKTKRVITIKPRVGHPLDKKKRTPGRRLAKVPPMGRKAFSTFLNEVKYNVVNGEPLKTEIAMNPFYGRTYLKRGLLADTARIGSSCFAYAMPRAKTMRGMKSIYGRCSKYADRLRTKHPASLPGVGTYLIDGLSDQKQDFFSSSSARKAANALFNTKFSRTPIVKKIVAPATDKVTAEELASLYPGINVPVGTSKTTLNRIMGYRTKRLAKKSGKQNKRVVFT